MLPNNSNQEFDLKAEFAQSRFKIQIFVLFNLKKINFYI